jgi:hypothetical protein
MKRLRGMIFEDASSEEGVEDDDDFKMVIGLHSLDCLVLIMT